MIRFFVLSLLLFSSYSPFPHCGSHYGQDLSFEELFECLNLFCLCNRFDNCSQLSPIEDVMIMLLERYNGVVMCSGLLAKVNEPEGKSLRWDAELGYEDKHQFYLIKESEEMQRIVFSFVDSRGETFIKWRDRPKQYPVIFNNLFHGMNSKTSGFLSGFLGFWNR